MIEIRELKSEDYAGLRAALIELLCDAVDHGASVNFLAPMDVEIAARFWDRAAGQLDTRERVIMIALDDGVLAGSVQLALATQPNGLARAEVQKMFVHTTERRRGIATQLMSAIEEAARKLNRTLLVLDTETGSDAQPMYEKLGYVRVGEIPDFALNTSGVPKPATFYYKKI